MEAFVIEDRSLMVREPGAAMFDISKSLVQNILPKKLKMKRVPSAWVAHHLTME